MLIALYFEIFRLRVKGAAFISDMIDISPEGGKEVLMKRLIRRGDLNKPPPRTRDTVRIYWKVSFLNKTVIYNSRTAKSEGNLFLQYMNSIYLKHQWLGIIR